MSTDYLYDPLGPRGKRWARLASLVTVTLFALLIVVLLQRLDSRGQLDPGRWAILGDLSTGVPQTLGRALIATLKAASLAMVLALVAGTLLAFGRLSRSRALRRLCGTVVEGFRGVPLLLLMLFASLGLPQAGIELSLLTIVVASLVAYNGSVLCEIIRGGIVALPRGQLEAAEAMGVNYRTALVRVLLPQAVPAMLPVIISQMVILLKDTSLGYIIGYSELLRSGRSVVEFYGNTYALQIYVAVGGMYIVVNFAISTLARQVAKRQHGPSRRSVPPAPAEPAVPAGR